MKSLWYYEKKIGIMGIAQDDQGITDVFLGEREPDPDMILEETPLLRQAAKEIEEYLDGKRREFQVDIHPEGTDFQRKVWEALCDIPYGETRSYQEVAESIGNPKACRAVGMANHRNPIMILVPCHRVIGKNGSLTGYGSGLEIKEFLLNLENPRRMQTKESQRKTIRQERILADTMQTERISAGVIRQALEAMAEPEFQRFSSSLIPNIPPESVLGVRLPLLRQMAAKIAKGDWRSYLAQAQDDSLEEIMLQSMVIGKIQAPLPEVLELIRGFLPKIDNWSVCDSFCAGLKQAKTHPKEIWDFIQPYFQAKEEYQVRFAAVMLLDYYVEEAYIEEALRLLEEVRHDSYYVKMAVAWAISKFYVRFPKAATEFLKKRSLDEDTYQKTLQKILESRAVDADQKAQIRGMKRGRTV